MQSITQVMRGHKPVIAVVTIDHHAHALSIAKALNKGGVSILEFTLRNKHGLDAIKIVREEMPDLCVGAGTLIKPAQFATTKKAGAQFSVSPGLTPALIRAASDQQTPYLPGATTPSEIMIGIENGFSVLKFFPAQSSGGLNFIKDLAGPFPEVKFCPTGGVDESNIHRYLSTDNVLCAGTSWLTPQKLVQEENWEELTRRARIMTKSLAVI